MNRIVSLVPAATEWIFALGAGDRLVGVSHECDYPPDVRHLPRVTTTPIDADASGAEIDAAVRALHAGGVPVIGIDAARLAHLAPDLIVTQSLCAVCAVSDDGLAMETDALGSRVFSMTGTTLAGVLRDVAALASAIGPEIPGDRTVAAFQRRLEGARLHEAVHPRPRVLCLEWLDPPFLAGHWVPELIEAAGGVDAGAEPGAHSHATTWSGINSIAADLILVALCGMDLGRARRELQQNTHARDALRARYVPVWLMDGNAYTSRPGPRLIDAVDGLRALLQRTPHPAIERWA